MSWAILDQGLTSISNLLLALLVARSSDASVLGVLGVVLAYYTLGLVVARAACGEPLLLVVANRRDTSIATCSAVSGATALAGSALAVLSILVALVVGGQLLPAMAVLALFMPGLMLQDTYRLWFFAAEQPAKATALDALWLALQTAFFATLFALGRADLLPLLCAWGLAAGVAALWGWNMTRARIGVHAGFQYLKTFWPTSRLLAADAVLALGPTQVALLLIGLLFSLDVAGSLRAGLVVLGPISVLAQSLSYSLIPVMRRRVIQHQSVTAASCSIAVAMATVSCIWAFIALLGPRWLQAVLGRALETSQPVLVPLAVYFLLNSASIGPLLGLRAMLALKRALVVRLYLAPIAVVAPAVGAAAVGASGAAWGCALGGAATLLGWTLGYARASRPAAA